MAKIFAGALAGKQVVNVGGSVIGDLENLVFDLETGKLINLVVKPGSALKSHNYQSQGKFLLIPFVAVVAVKDYIVVDESRAAAAKG